MITALLALGLSLVPEESAPPARGHFGIAYDAKTGKTVISGGVEIQNGSLVFCEDYWSWDGQRWEKVASTGLSIMGHRMTFDSKRGRVLLLGGSVNNTPACGELREWSANRWTTLGSSDALKALDPGFCYDSARDRLVVILPDATQKSLGTWICAGTEWSRVPGDLPEARSLFSTAYDAKHKREVLFGGRIGDASASTDVWQFDGAKWEKKSATGPTARSLAGLVYDDKLGAIVLHGGMGPEFKWLSDTWSWNGDRWTRLAENGPAIEFGMAYDARRDRVVLVGAPSHENTAATLETWEFDGKAWAKAMPKDAAGHEPDPKSK